ncbi:MAG TPA: tetratricopeptide repeat protein, partial [Casimicrobiaceae bacterium]
MLNRLFKRKPPSPTGAPAEATTQKADHLIQLGQPLEDRGELEEALELYRRAVDAAPNYSRAYMNAGHALIALKRWSEAEPAYRKAVECAPGYAPARFNLGQLLLTVGNVDEAEQQLLIARNLQPALVEVPIVLADLYETLGRLEEAEAQYAAAAAMTPSHPGALFNFGIFCLGQGRLEQAAELFAKARAVDPGCKDAESAVLFALNFRTDLDARDIAARHREVGRLFARDGTLRATNWPNSIEPDRRLRVGYASGDF